MKILQTLCIVGLSFLLFLSSCTSAPVKLFETTASQLGTTCDRSSNLLIIVYNFHTSCLGCNATIEETFSNDLLTKKFKPTNICIISKEIRPVETKSLKNDLVELGLDYPIIYSNDLYEAGLKTFSNYKETGGIINISPQEKIIFSSSLKNPDFFKEISK